MIKRLHSLDAMRAILMLIGVYFHLAHSYSLFPNPWSQNPETVSIVFDYFREISHYFRMHGFFLIAGFFGALLFERKGAREMILNRFKRIFLPLMVFIWPIYVMNRYSEEFAKHQNEGLGIIQSLEGSLTIFNSLGEFFPWVTIHLWFLYFLFFMSLFALAVKRVFINVNVFGKGFKKIISLLFEKPWTGTFLFCFVYGFFMSLMHMIDAQVGGAWLTWWWFFIPEGIKNFIAFGFFYFTGWHIYYQRPLLEKLNVKNQLTMLVVFFAIAITLAYNLSQITESPFPQMNAAFHGEKSELDSYSDVTFSVDLSGFDFDQFENNDVDFRGVFVQGTFNGWCGDCDNQMTDEDGDLVYTITVEVRKGFHEYIFTVNGWDGIIQEKWDWLGGIKVGTECDAIPGDEDGTYGLRLGDVDIILNAVCWQSCDDCDGKLVASTKISDEEASKRRVFDKAFFFLWNFLVPVQVMLVLAIFVNFFNVQSTKIKYISDASYWVYIIHLPLTHFIPGLFHQSSMNVFIKFTITSIIVTGICFTSYHYLVRSTFIGEFLNGRRYSNR